ncbi:MAG: hypothetical protein ACE5HP_05970 [Gemmatimonadota bacterium]
MRHDRLLFATLIWSPIVLAACGGGTVTVQVLTEGSEGAQQPQKDLVVEFLPFDRDSLFDLLAARATAPEPEVPPALIAMFDTAGDLQERWRQADAEWSEVRDQLKQLSDRLQGMDARSRQYRQLYDRFLSLERRERALNRQKAQAFDRFTSVQNRGLAQVDSIRAVRESWEAIAFQDYFSVMDSILDARDAEVYEDTTGADGALTRRLPGGRWWVHTRIPVGLFDEYYWNVPIASAEVDTLRLTPENAERRLRL